MKNRILLVIGLVTAIGLQAQKAVTKKYSFHSINSIGVANGNNGAGAVLQTVNGFRNGPLFAGIGLGLDYYQYRTVPLFADIRYDFGKKKNKLFAYTDAGINFSWVPRSVNDEVGIWWGNPGDFSNGMYADAGIGLNTAFKNGNALVLSLGYSRKTMKESFTYTDWRTGQPQTDVNTYRFNRIMIKLGFSF